MDVVNFCLCVFVFVLPIYSLEGDHVCKKNVTTQSGDLITEEKCCTDYEEINGVCVECSPGFFGENCSVMCPDQHYGRKCLSKCSCREIQICHPVCGCLQRLDLNSSNSTSFSTRNVTSSYLAGECPTTIDLLSTSIALRTPIPTAIGKHPTNSKIAFIIGAAGVTGVCLLFGIALLYRFHLERKKAEYRVHHNMVYDLEDTSRIQESPSGQEQSAEPLYGTCNYEDACYSTLKLRVNNESVQEPCTSRQPVLTDDDNVYEFARRYTHYTDE